MFYVMNASGGNPTKLFFFVNEDFFRFSLISLVILKLVRFFAYATNTQAYQQKSENRKNESLVGLTPADEDRQRHENISLSYNKLIPRFSGSRQWCDWRIWKFNRSRFCRYSGWS